ncbi:Dyp-type peroxidase domain-containing protein [Nocardia xishanensis]|uniref:Dyp-type peroxidase domain-containing protein n=1 Tax=Nocardia xishanensis TaxID=238964 RepID=UPI0008351187|nr:Dyp-type peroxidase domain-containing protein [Nocardia xishanensis]
MARHGWSSRPRTRHPEHTHGGHNRLDAGLLFAAYMNNPPAQFIAAQRALAAGDRLNPLIQHTGSVFFAIPPGIAQGGSIADTLLS